MACPQLGEFGAHGAEIVDHPAELRVVGRMCRIGTEGGDNSRRDRRPVDMHAAVSGIGEKREQAVVVGAAVAEHRLRRIVDREQIPVPVPQHRRRHPRVEQVPQLRGDLGTARPAGPWRVETGQQIQVRTLGLGQAQHPADRVEHLGRDLDVAALLEPGVPGHADPGQHGDLLTPQTRCPAPAHRRHADVTGREPRPAGAQKVAELLAATPRHRRGFAGHMPR